MLSPAMDMADLMAAMEVMVMAADPMVDTEAMAMARRRLRPPLMLSPAMDMDMADLMAAMEVMVMAADPMVDTEATATARGRLRPPLRLSLAMDMDMEDLMAAMEVMVMADPMVDMEAMAIASKP